MTPPTSESGEKDAIAPPIKEGLPSNSTPKPEEVSSSRTVTMQKSDEGRTICLLSDSESDDDVMVFGKGRAFDVASKKTKEEEETKTKSNSIDQALEEAKEMAHYKQLDRKAVILDLPLSAKENVKQEIDLPSFLPDSCSEANNDASDVPNPCFSANVTPKAKQAIDLTSVPDSDRNRKTETTAKIPPNGTKKDEIPMIDLTSPSDSRKHKVTTLKLESNNEETMSKQLLPLADKTLKAIKVDQQKIKSIVAMALLSDSESNNDDDNLLLFGHGSVFSNDYRPPKLARVKPEVKEESIKHENDRSTHDEKEMPPNQTKDENDHSNLKVEKEELSNQLKDEKVPKIPVVVAKSKPKLTPEQVEEERLRHLEEISGDADRAIQLMLWDIGFSYNIYAHQFEAVRFVAGLVPTFPFSKSVDVSMSQNSPEGAQLRSLALKQAARELILLDVHNKTSRGGIVHALPTKGMLLADEMGLGKTIEALAGAALRNAMLSYDLEHSDLPTLIVSPQDGIQNQWYETLVKSGVHPSCIEVWGESEIQSMRRQDRYFREVLNDPNHKGQTQSYILCTRYNIQSEMRKFFKLLDTASKLLSPDSVSDRSVANARKKLEKELNDLKIQSLFRNVPIPLIEKLRNQYQSDKGKAKNKYIQQKEKCQDCVARLIRTYRRNDKDLSQFSFQTIIVDEAHFCKNVLAYWGLGLALLGTKTRRTVLLTGTPYNNGPSDMTALMTYIDPTHEAGKVEWWENAVASTGNAADEVSGWRKAYLLRRTKDVLLQKLPPRVRAQVDVPAIPSELWIYLAYEGKFLSCLRKLKQNLEATSPEARHRAKKTFEVMMACMACMRMALVHPIMIGGREMTIQFSPSRRHLLKREERPKQCVFCISDPTKTAEKEAAKKAAKQDGTHTKLAYEQNQENKDDDDDLRALVGTARTDMDLDDDQLDDGDVDGDYVSKSKKERELEEKKKGPIVPLGPDFCLASESRCRHFAHEKCIEKNLKEFNTSCPRCHDLNSRIHATLPHNMYCQEIKTHIDDSDSGGFTASAKIEKAIEWFQTTVPKGDKAIFLSFFKGSLDLIEGILVSKLGIDCARYDGDVSKEARTNDLERFKTSSTCRVLLATVQSGGTGLNITEANHICFLDRWFNPCVHDQAESRCHRIGQKKSVNIAYLDTTFTIDIVMKRINVLKEGNASVILADGTSLGDRWSLGYRNVSGVIGETMNALRDMREQIIQSNGDAPLPPYVESDLEEKMAQMAQTKATSSVKREEVEQMGLKNLLEHLGAGSTTSIYESIIGPLQPSARPNHSNAMDLDRNRNKNHEPGKRFSSLPSHGSGTENVFHSSIPPFSYMYNKKPPPGNSATNLPSKGSFARSISSTTQRMMTTPILRPTIGKKRSTSTKSATTTQGSPKRSRFSHGLSAIVSKKKNIKELMRRKKRGDL